MGRGMPWRARSQKQLDDNEIRVGQLWRFRVCHKPWMVRYEEYNALILSTKIDRIGGKVRIWEMHYNGARQVDMLADDLVHDAFLLADV